MWSRAMFVMITFLMSSSSFAWWDQFPINNVWCFAVAQVVPVENMSRYETKNHDMLWYNSNKNLRMVTYNYVKPLVYSADVRNIQMLQFDARACLAQANRIRKTLCDVNPNKIYQIYAALASDMQPAQGYYDVVDQSLICKHAP